MKKLFIAAMALATIVSCSKDDANYGDLQKSQKSVTISIANLAKATRVENPNGGQTAPGKAEACVTDANDLKFLFADANGKILVVKKISDGTPANTEWDYTFHKLPETVVMMGVAANSENAVEGKTLKDVYDEWMTETVGIAYDEITVYSTDASDNGEFNEQMGIDLKPAGDCSLDGHEYPLYSASVRVAPAHARIEIHSIGCTDLGENTYGFKEITLTDLTLADGAYSQNLGQVLTPTAKTATLADGKVWSWNILPQDVSNMTLKFDVVGKNYNVAVPTKTVTVNQYNVNNAKIEKFAAENIYVINLLFKEANIDEVDTYICVNVDVTIAEWVINDTDVDFATGPNN